mmetsp:Transcript_6723/g.16196  ORF Transcript_6723/g.16196 Transcript_6723/m.16196 type:complete len:282 (-) Transcript_6723:2435-3280(-)
MQTRPSRSRSLLQALRFCSRSRRQRSACRPWTRSGHTSKSPPLSPPASRWSWRCCPRQSTPSRWLACDHPPPTSSFPGPSGGLPYTRGLFAWCNRSGRSPHPRASSSPTASLEKSQASPSPSRRGWPWMLGTRSSSTSQSLGGSTRGRFSCRRTLLARWCAASGSTTSSASRSAPRSVRPPSLRGPPSPSRSESQSGSRYRCLGSASRLDVRRGRMSAARCRCPRRTPRASCTRPPSRTTSLSACSTRHKSSASRKWPGSRLRSRSSSSILRPSAWATSSG